VHGEALQADLRRVDARAFHLRRAQQLTGQVVSPAVITARQSLGTPATVRDGTGAMAADIEEAADRAAVVREQQRFAAEARREVIAWLSELRDVTDELP